MAFRSLFIFIFVSYNVESQRFKQHTVRVDAAYEVLLQTEVVEGGDDRDSL